MYRQDSSNSNNHTSEYTPAVRQNAARSSHSYQIIMDYKPEHTSVSESTLIDEFIKEYKNTDMISSLNKLKGSFSTFRKVRGDGNCFVRAVGFAYLVAKGKQDFKSAFPHADKVQLKRINFPNRSSVKTRYQDKMGAIGEIVEKAWSQIFVPSLQKDHNYAKNISQFMNRYEVFDTFVVAYFRALCYLCFQQKKGDYQIFYEDNMAEFRDIERGIITFGQESQGFILKAMADALHCKFKITQVDKTGVNSMQFTPDDLSSDSKELQLFFRPGHYDILEQKTEQKPQGNNRQAQTDQPDSVGMDIQESIQGCVEDHWMQRKCFRCSVQQQGLNVETVCKEDPQNPAIFASHDQRRQPPSSQFSKPKGY